MRLVYDEGGIQVFHGHCDELNVREPALRLADPPYNVGYHYAEYRDKLSDDDYWALLERALRPPSIVLHYPTALMQLQAKTGWTAERCVAWVYHANTPKQWRMLAWFGVVPDFSQVKQPYKNQTDKRVRKLMEDGSAGADLYDWWQVEQVKNVDDDKTDHPCQIPVLVMERALAVTPGTAVIVDPFMGSGTTLLAARNLGRRAIGVDVDETYCQIAVDRLRQQRLW